MIKKFLTRRQFLNHGKLALLFLLNSCRNSSKKIRISLQSLFYPQSLKDSLPSSWHQENISFSEIKLEKNQKKISNSEFILINDGWINSINFEIFQNINELFPNDKLNNRAKEFLNTFKEHKRNKLYPIGLIPYAVVIKNNKHLIDKANNSWDFLLDEKLKGKVILPKSPRIIISLSKKIKKKNSLSELKDQAMLFDDQNSINWLINSNANVAIVPYSLSLKYLKIDSRLSIVFPEEGVPIIWNFVLSRSKNKNQILIDWINSLEKRKVVDALSNQGWYLPFRNEYSQNKYYGNTKNKNYGPSKKCWENSWSFSPLNKKKKLDLENLWNKS